MANNTITIKRVSYGKIETLPNDREYILITEKGISPVGNLADWIAWANDLIVSKQVRVIDNIMGEDYLIDL